MGVKVFSFGGKNLAGDQESPSCAYRTARPGWEMRMNRLHRNALIQRAIVTITSCLCLGVGTLLPEVRAEEESQAASRKLGPGDAIAVMVFREPELTGDFKVNEQGSINYPLLGKIQVMGRNPEEVASEIETLLEKDYVRDAQVSIDMIGKGAIQISVLGEVRAPGRFSFEAEERVELGTALLVAGGPTANSNLDTIEVKRRSGDDIESVRLSMPEDKGFVLRRDDSVIIAPILAAGAARPIVTILGQVARPGAMEMPAGRDLDLLTAVALAGGLTPTARTSKVIIRREGEEPVTVNVARIQKGEIPSPPLKGGDTVFVPESIF